jgi:hypothetical protein
MVFLRICGARQAHQRGKGGGITFLLPPRRAEVGQQVADGIPQRQALVLRLARFEQVQRPGNAARRRHAEAAGMDKGEKLQQVVGRKTLQLQPRRHGGGIAGDRHVRLEKGPGLDVGQLRELAVQRQAIETVPRHDQHGSFRNKQTTGRRRRLRSGLRHSY